MNIFIVAAPSHGPVGHALIERLACISPERRRNTPVIVVDDVSYLPERAASDVPTEYVRFGLEHFTGRGLTCESIARSMDTVVSNWVLVEFGQHDLPACIDFIVKLSRYNYLSNRLRHCNLVFSAPAISLGVLARTLNESFNNLPVGNAAMSQTGQIRRLFIITHIKRVLISLPLPRGVLHRCHAIVRRIYRRLLGAV
ncbi:hypothetical protein PS3A_09710 [Pseudomonas sp. 3A(2025)]